MSQYIGKTISLISQADIRYVGILESIDGSKGTISLQDVRVFGTEGRVVDVNRVVYPSNQIYEHIMLSGPDVKSLNILEVPIEQVVPEPVPVSFNPMAGFFPMGASQQPAVQPKSAPEEPKPEAAQPAQPAEPAQPAQPVKAAKPQPEPKSTSPAPVQASEPAPAPAPSQRQPVKNNASQNNASQNSKPAKISDDFDFESNNAKFQKDEEDLEREESEFYNKKSSFFDTISSSTEENNTERMRWNEEKQLNLDTFGQTSLRNNRNGYRGRGRGGRGGNRGGYRGRGRGRGGFNKQPEWA